jgi:hypothetical protein
MSKLLDNLKSKQFLLSSLAIMSGVYLMKSFYNYLSDYFKDKSLQKDIIDIINKHKHLLEDLRQLSKAEHCFLLYYIVLNTLYKKQINDLNIRRRKVLNDLEQYILIVNKQTQEFKFIEERILQIIYSELQEEGETEENENIPKVNEIKKLYYTNLNIQVNVTSANLVEIIDILHQKTRIYITELQDHMNYKNDYVDDKLHLLAEYRAFDYIFLNYNYEREEIEKGMIEYNLIIQEK